MPKAVEAFRNIGEVSAELGIKKHVLRFWEAKFPQLKPMKRGGGRRLYRPADVQLLRGIRDLLETAGYTIKGVQKILREQGTEHVKLLADGVAASNAHEHMPVRLPSPACLAEGPTLFTATELRALRTVMAELEACQGMLADSAPLESEAPRLRRALQGD